MQICDSFPLAFTTFRTPTMEEARNSITISTANRNEIKRLKILIGITMTLYFEYELSDYTATEI